MAVGRFRALAAAALAVAALACQDEAARLGEHQQRGEAYLAEQKYPEAVLEFRNAISIDPNHAPAHWGMARALLAQKDLRKAYWELQETVRLDPGNVEAQLRYGQFLLFGKGEDLDRAVDTADRVLASKPQPKERAAALVLKARALESLQRGEEALAAYEGAVKALPDDPGPLLLLANYHRQAGRAQEAEALFRKLVEVESSFATHAALAGFIASLGREHDAEAEATYRKALELAEGDQRKLAYSLLANFLVARDRGSEAEATLRQGIDEIDEDLDLIYGLARYYHAKGDTQRAEGMIEEAARSRPGDPEPLLLLSTYRARFDDLPGALEAAERAIEVAPADRRTRLRKAEVLVDLGYREKDTARVAEGRSIVQAVLAQEQANPDALFVKAKIDLAEDKRGDALAALRQVIDERPEWAQAHFLLGSVLFLDGDRAGARSAVARSLELDANLVPAQKLMARLHAALGDHGLAIEAGRRALERDPQDASLHVLVAQSLVKQQRMDDALRELRQVPEDRRGAEEEFALGRVYVLKGERDEARRHLLAAAQHEPNRYEILRALLDLDMRDGRLEESSARVQEALRARPDDARLVQLHGEVSLYTGHTAEAESSFRRAIDLDPNDLQAYQSLARYLAVTGRPEEVVHTYERALGANPQSATLNLIVGSLYELRSRPQDAVQRYEEAIRLDPNLAVAKNNLAYLIAEQGGNLDRALDLAQEAKSLLPDNPNAADTLGWVLYKKNVPSAAIGYLREAESAMPPDDPLIDVVRHHLALAYEANGEPERAREVLERAIQNLDHLFRSGGDTADRPEPAWAAEVRSMYARLADDS
jgi:tetratricopeptide (TPR) repeat protein